MKLQLTIFHKLVMTLLLVSLAPLCAMWYLGQSNARRELDDSIGQSLVSAMNTAATGIGAWDDGNVRALRHAALLGDVVSMKAERQNPVLASMNISYEWSYLLFTVAPDGSNVGRSDGKEATYYGDRSYFREVVAGKALGRQVLIGKSSGKPSLILAAPVRNDDRALVGVIAMAMNLGDVSETVAGVRIGETGHAILLDAGNKVIAHGVANKVKTALQDFSAYPGLAAAGDAGQPARYSVEGRQMIGLSRKLPQGWTLLIEQEYAEAYAPLARMESEARILIAAAAALVIGVAFLLGRQLTRPVRQLTAIAQEMSNGRLDVAIPHMGRGDEIGALARAVDRLGISMRLAMDRLRKRA